MDTVADPRNKLIWFGVGRPALAKRPAAGLLLVHGDEILLSQRALHMHDGGLWSTPGGVCNEAEEPLVAAFREFHEELGVHAPEGEIIEVRSSFTLRREYIVFVLEVDVKTPVSEMRFDDETSDAAWVNLTTASMDPHVHYNLRPLLKELL